MNIRNGSYRLSRLPRPSSEYFSFPQHSVFVKFSPCTRDSVMEVNTHAPKTYHAPGQVQPELKKA